MSKKKRNKIEFDFCKYPCEIDTMKQGLCDCLIQNNNKEDDSFRKEKQEEFRRITEREDNRIKQQSKNTTSPKT